MLALQVPSVTVWSYTSLKQRKTYKATLAIPEVPQNANTLLSKNRQKVLDVSKALLKLLFFRLFSLNVAVSPSSITPS